MAALLLGVATMAGRARALPFEPGEDFVMKVHLLGLPAGDLRVAVGQGQLDGVSTWPLEMHLKTTGLVGWMYALDESFVSHFDPAANDSLGYDLKDTVHGRPHEEHARYFGQAAFMRTVLAGRAKIAIRPILPGAMDMLAAIFRLRSEPLGGSAVRIPIFTGTKSWFLDARVIGHERVSTDAGSFPTVVLRCRTFFKGKFASDREITVWLSDDARRIPVKIEADFAIGSLDAVLEKFHGGALAEAERTR